VYCSIHEGPFSKESVFIILHLSIGICVYWIKIKEGVILMFRNSVTLTLVKERFGLSVRNARRKFNAIFARGSNYLAILHIGKDME
jgi:hypothetical protein